MKILMVSMPSLHFFRWTEQLKDAGHEIYWFDVIDGGAKVERISWIHQIVGWKLKWEYPGRYFIKDKLPKVYALLQQFNENNTAKIFEQKLLEIQPNVVHSFAMQISCIPILNVMQNHQSIKWIYSSWGSDMYYSQQLDIDFLLMNKALNRINFLITDCFRDFNIAKEKGFKNEFLGVYPGNGGIFFDENAILPLNQRKFILIKGYNDDIGRGINIIKAITHNVIKLLKGFTIVIYGADDEIVQYIENCDVYKKIETKIYLKTNFIENASLLKIMGASYIYIGNSISDGMPNSLIEASGMGAFPIQSNPGNATTELIIDNQNGLLIQDPLNSKEIESLIIKALQNYKMVKMANEYNISTVKSKYNRQEIKNKITTMYDEIYKKNI
jgi:glycosyltransferase involved in cell wall biosynthesis